MLRTKAGGIFRGVNTGVVQNTPGGGIGGFGSSVGAGAGGTNGGAGGAGSGASGLVSSTLGTGTNVSSYDPAITGSLNYQSQNSPLSNLAIYGVPVLKDASLNANIGYAQAFPTGTSLQFTYNSDRATTNSPSQFLLPELDSSFQLLARQHLLAGFGLGPNLRYLRIARNDQKISDQSFELQVISTVTQIANIYWDLVAAYEDEQVKQASLDFANDTLTSCPQAARPASHSRPRRPQGRSRSSQPGTRRLHRQIPAPIPVPSSSKTPSPKTSTTPSSKPCPSAPSSN